MTPDEAPGAAGPPPQQDLHATTVALPLACGTARGVLIEGPAGAGKSGLALALMALGARLVADDRTLVLREGAGLIARAHPATRGMIEARGVGILAADPLPEAPLWLAIDLGTTEVERLPPLRYRRLLGCRLPLVHAVESPHFPAAILQYLRMGRSDT